jgi:hypothetical protein
MQFGEPETWGMKVGEFLESKEFTLPQQKPQALLDLQEQNRKSRILDALNKIGGGMESSSRQLIERENFSKAGIAKVVDYVNSLPDGTEVSIKDIREYIEKNNIDASSRSISNIIGGSAPGKERFKPTIKFVEQLGSVKYNEDTFKKIDELLENPKITSFRNLGEALGYKTPKPSGKRGATVGGGTPLSRQSPVIKAYVKSRGGDPFEGFKVNFYERGQPKVEQTLKLQADGMSTNSIADKLFKGNRTNVRRIFRLFRPEAIKDPTPKADDPTTTTKTRASARRQKREQEAFKKVGKKTADQTKKVIEKINSKNADILKMSDAEILNDPKIRYAMSIDATGLRMNEPLKFDKYSDLSDKEFVKKVRDKAKAKTFYTPEHISEVAKEKLNTAFPNNLVNAPGRMGSQVQAMKEYLRKNPDGEFADQIDEVLLKTGMQFKTGGKTFGVKKPIVFDSKTNTSNIVEDYFFKPGMQPDGQLKDKPGGNTKGSFGGKELAKATGEKILQALRVLGSPGVSSAFGASELAEGNIKTAGASLLLPEIVSKAAPAGKGILSRAGSLLLNPYGRYARALTPVGLATIGVGMGKDVYDEYKRREALTDEERLAEDLEAQEKFDEVMIGAAEGGRIGFKDGPEDPSKRKFMKLVGILSLLPYGLGKLVKPAAKVAPVVAEGAKLGFDNFLKLVEKIKTFGKKDPGRTTMDRQEATIYTGKDGSEYELIEDLTTGDIRITKDKPGVQVYGRGTEDVEGMDVIQDRSQFEFKVGQADETTKGKKPPDEYEEGKLEAFDGETFDAVDDVDDQTVKEILDEID